MADIAGAYAPSPVEGQQADLTQRKTAKPEEAQPDLTPSEEAQPKSKVRVTHNDSRAVELERRVVQSLYLMRSMESGSVPPQESALLYNSW